MFPSHLDGGFHTVGQDDELRWSTVIMGAKTYDVDLSHSGRENSEKTRVEQGGRPFSEQKREALSRTLFYLAPRSRPVICSAREPEIPEEIFTV
jgi:hypothetical protein